MDPEASRNMLKLAGSGFTVLCQIFCAIARGTRFSTPPVAAEIYLVPSNCLVVAASARKAPAGFPRHHNHSDDVKFA